MVVMVMVINSALVRTHQSTYSGSFGPVLPPGWIDYTRSVAVPLDVEGGAHPTSTRDAMPTCAAGRLAMFVTKNVTLLQVLLHFLRFLR